MAGSFVSLDVHSQKQIAQMFNRLLTQGSDLEPAFREIKAGSPHKPFFGKTARSGTSLTSYADQNHLSGMPIYLLLGYWIENH